MSIGDLRNDETAKAVQLWDDFISQVKSIRQRVELAKYSLTQLTGLSVYDTGLSASQKAYVSAIQTMIAGLEDGEGDLQFPTIPDDSE